MRSLSPSTRAKAIELANHMMAHGNMNRQEAIQASIIEARRQARAAFPDAQNPSAYTFPQA
ncbi:MAG TPA: hypothetical protein VGB67_17245 [Fibrella sp.]